MTMMQYSSKLTVRYVCLANPNEGEEAGGGSDSTLLHPAVWLIKRCSLHPKFRGQNFNGSEIVGCFNYAMGPFGRCFRYHSCRPRAFAGQAPACCIQCLLPHRLPTPTSPFRSLSFVRPNVSARLRRSEGQIANVPCSRNARRTSSQTIPVLCCCTLEAVIDSVRSV